MNHDTEFRSIAQATQPVQEPRRLLSSQQTFWMKVIFPIFWIGGFAVATITLWLPGGGGWEGANGEPVDPAFKWFFLGMTSVGTVFIWWICMRLKRVQMDNSALYISNYSTEIVVPLNNVAGVTENRLINIHPVTIVFRSETAFGSQIVFMPESRWFGFWSSHPVVEEIQNAVARAVGGGPIA
jgi:hypothetical protein